MTGAAALPRIVQVASGREWRGGERQVFLLARHLTTLGVDQIVVTAAGGRLAVELKSAGIKTRTVGWRAGLSPAGFRAVLIEAAAPNAILHAHDAHALTLTGAAALLARRRFVVTRRLDLPLRRPGFWVKADRIIAVSNSVRRALERDGIAPERIVVAHSGIDLSPPPSTSPEGVRRTLGLPPTGRLVVTVGALVPTKGQDLVVRVAAELRNRIPDLRWVFAGAGPDRHRLEELARNLGVGSVIHLVGQVADPRPLIAAAEAVVHCPVHEALGTGLMEAMVVGIPIVACQVGGIEELVGEGAGILVAQRDPVPVAQAVERILGDEKLRRDVTHKAAEVVRQFSAEGMATKVLDVYRSLVLDR